MSSVISEVAILTVPSYSIIGPTADQLVIREATIDVLTLQSLNGTPISGTLVFTSGAQVISDKLLVDTNTYIVNNTDNSIEINFAANGAAATTATLGFNQSTTSIYNIPDAGSCNIVVSEGAATINGQKTFSSAIITPGISNPGTGVSISTTSAPIAINNIVNIRTSAVTTAGASSAALFTINTTTNTVYSYMLALTGISTAYDTIALQTNIKVKNVNSVITIGSPYNEWDDTDSALTGITISWAASGSILTVSVAGVAGENISWAAELTEISISA